MGDGINYNIGEIRTLARTNPSFKQLLEKLEPTKAKPGSPQKATDAQLIDSYQRTRSCWKTAAEFGMCGQSVHERLQKLGVIEEWRVTEAEMKEIAALYDAGFMKGDGRLQALCEKLGRTKPLISRLAKKLGFSNSKRGFSKELAKRMGDRVREDWKAGNHPRGMLGKTHTQETKDALSEKLTGRIVPEEQTMRQLKTRVARYGTLAPPHMGRGSWKAGWREIGGKRIYARSMWEANYARYLQWLMDKQQIQKWEHEPETFWFEAIKRGVRSYLPDFRVTFISGIIEYHEVKGWMDARSATKIKRMALYYPAVILRVLDKQWFRANNRRFSKLVPFWEVSKRCNVTPGLGL